jgi:polyisoprenoid-binding protein YceI
MSVTSSFKSAALALALAGFSTSVSAAPEAYVLDASHSQIVFTYNHLGFSTTTSMFSGFDGDIQFDQEDPAASSVSVSFPVTTLLTGWEKRFGHFMSPKFFNAEVNSDVSFASTGIEVTGEKTALITGDLTLNGVTKSVVLDAVLNGVTDSHPMAKKPWAGFDATATLLRTDYGLGQFAPYVSDEVSVKISIEATKAE